MKTLGNLRGEILDAAVNITTGGFPQLVLKLEAKEMYDEAAKEWAAWEEFFEDGSNEANDRVIFAYLVLFGEKGATLSCDQIKLITGWEGDSFKALAAMDLVGTKIQWRNAENTYNDKTTVQVAFVDVYDAAPGGSCKKIDDKAIASLDTKFAEFLSGGTNKPEGKRSTRGKNTKDKTPEENEAPTEEKPKAAGRRGRKPNAKKTVAPKTEAPTETEPPAPTDDAPVGTVEEELFGKVEPCTKQEAWTAACEGKKQDVTVDQLTKVWQKVIATVAPGKTHADLTDEDWSAIRAGVLDEVS